MDNMTADGEVFEHNGVTYYVGWMRSEAGKDDYFMWLNEQPHGGFCWKFLDYRPEDKENYKKIYISAHNPRVNNNG